MDNRGKAACRTVADLLNLKCGQTCGRTPNAVRGQGFDSPRLHHFLTRSPKLAVMKRATSEYIAVGTAWISCAAAQPERVNRVARASQKSLDCCPRYREGHPWATLWVGYPGTYQCFALPAGSHDRGKWLGLKPAFNWRKMLRDRSCGSAEASFLVP